jgi:hypothetical protein
LAAEVDATAHEHAKNKVIRSLDEHNRDTLAIVEQARAA